EPLQHFPAIAGRVLEQLATNHLQSHDAVGAALAGPVDHAHTALSQLLQQVIVAEPCWPWPVGACPPRPAYRKRLAGIIPRKGGRCRRRPRRRGRCCLALPRRQTQEEASQPFAVQLRETPAISLSIRRLAPLPPICNVPDQQPPQQRPALLSR